MTVGGWVVFKTVGWFLSGGFRILNLERRLPFWPCSFLSRARLFFLRGFFAGGFLEILWIARVVWDIGAVERKVSILKY